LKLYRVLGIAAFLLAFVVVVVGAYVRLSDAGLGCPDWPGCYGKPLPADIAHPDALAKAWKEMGHRYLAGTLGLLIVLLAAMGWRFRRSRWLASSIVLVVMFQATLGMWTVTMLLKPAIVTAHLLGGMTTLALLCWLALSLGEHAPAAQMRTLRTAGAVALTVLSLQIMLGGWVSANYAALACPDLPDCPGGMDFANAFHVVRELGQTAEGGLLPLDALRSIHLAHRMFALVALGAVVYAALRAFTLAPVLGALVGMLVLAQFALGVANVALGLPLPLAAAHNAGAAALLVALVVLNFFAFRGLRPSR
jgi:cytochrome c oxidase assembly protein subunit 15